MAMKIVKAIKTIGLFSLILIGVVACEKDFQDVGLGLVDNNLFTTNYTSFDVTAYNVNVDSSRVDGLSQYLLGVYNDPIFGKLSTTFVSQIGLASISDFGDNVSIDTIVLDIPYYATNLSTSGLPEFRLDSIFGDKNVPYNLSVYELGTFLNTLDSQDPTKNKKYYSNDSYTKKDLLYSGEFKPNANDTVLYVKRRFIDNDISTIDDIDTIKKSTVAPSIKIPLDTTFFRTHFIDQQDSNVFTNYQYFIDYFRGIIIEANGDDGSLIELAMSDATVTIYYTNDILTDETDTDLNGDGDSDDEDVPVRTKQSKVYSLSGGVKASQYFRDYIGSDVETALNTSNKLNGDEKLYIQGVAGTNAIIKMNLNLDSLRQQNLLINEASLTFYVDNPQDTIVPQKLFLYNYDYNSQIRDATYEYAFGGIGGNLIKDDNNKPIKYKFTITDYISQLLKPDNTSELSTLALKVYHPTDARPDPTQSIDTIVKDYSWLPKGVVLNSNNTEDNKKLKLEIFYTESNE